MALKGSSVTFEASSMAFEGSNEAFQSGKEALLPGKKKGNIRYCIAFPLYKQQQAGNACPPLQAAPEKTAKKAHRAYFMQTDLLSATLQGEIR